MLLRGEEDLGGPKGAVLGRGAAKENSVPESKKFLVIKSLTTLFSAQETCA